MYTLWNTEADIRRMSFDYQNVFAVAVYACCRENHNSSKHTGHIGGTKDEAKAHFMLVLTEEFEALEAKDASDK